MPIRYAGRTRQCFPVRLIAAQQRRHFGPMVGFRLGRAEFPSRLGFDRGTFFVLDRRPAHRVEWWQRPQPCAQFAGIMFFPTSPLVFRPGRSERSE